MSSFPQIGSRYDGPAFDRPSLRRLPAGWCLEETRHDRRKYAWFRVRRWLWITFLATVALGYVVAVRAVLT